MLGRIFLFEIRYQLRQPLFWISAILFFLMTFGAVTTDVIVVGGSIGSVNRNAPFVLMQLLLVMTLIGTFLTTAFAAGSVYRDFESQADAIFFSLPLRKAEYLFGRLSGALVVSWLVYVAVLLGVFIGGFMPWLEPERIGPFQMAPYLFSMLAFVLPNVIITGSIFFALATLTRPTPEWSSSSSATPSRGFFLATWRIGLSRPSSIPTASAPSSWSLGTGP